MKKKVDGKMNIVIYRDKNRDVILRADVGEETILASLNQIAEIFNVQKAAISKHLKNIFETGELDPKATVSKMETVQNEGGRTIKRQIEFYNLDAIIAVGYRVNSKQATGFRIWATKTLRQYILHGYAINEKRLLQVKDKFRELQTTVSFLQEKSQRTELSGQEGEILNLLASYAKTFTILGDYDKGALKEIKGAK